MSVRTTTLQGYDPFAPVRPLDVAVPVMPAPQTFAPFAALASSAGAPAGAADDGSMMFERDVVNAIRVAANLIAPYDSADAAAIKNILADLTACGNTLDDMQLYIEQHPGIDLAHDKVLHNDNAALAKEYTDFAELALTIVSGGALLVDIGAVAIGELGLAKFTAMQIKGMPWDIAQDLLGDYLDDHRWIVLPPSEQGTADKDMILGDLHGGGVHLLDGDDTFIGASTAAYTVWGGDGDDMLIGGSSGNDHMIGGTGNDTIILPNGALFAEGGNGDDWIMTLPLGQMAAVGEHGNDVLIGGAHHDDLIGGEDRVQDLLGLPKTDKDHIIGGGGADTIDGAMGDDILIGDNLSDGTDPREADLIAPFVAQLKDKYAGDGGLGGADTITGYAGDDVILGGRGNDTIYGDDVPGAPTKTGTGNDTIFGDAGDDQIWGGGGNDHEYGGEGNDTFHYQGGGGAALGEGGDDIFTITTDAKIASAGMAFNGGSGTDTLDASQSPLGVTIDLVAQKWGFTGGPMAAFTSVEKYTLSDHNDVLIVSGDGYTFDGGAGDDVVEIVSGVSNTLTGGAGHDEYVFKDPNSVLDWDHPATVQDFEAGHDKVVLDFGQSQIDQYWFSAWAIGSNPSDIDVFVAFEDAAELEIPELVLHHQNLANYSFDNDGGGFYVIDNASAIAVIFGGTVFDPGWQLGH